VKVALKRVRVVGPDGELDVLQVQPDEALTLYESSHRGEKRNVGVLSRPAFSRESNAYDVNSR
jgi:hypothetical protein